MCSRPKVPRGWRRRSVGDPGLKMRMPWPAWSRDAEDVDGYLALVPEGRRAVLSELRDACRRFRGSGRGYCQCGGSSPTSSSKKAAISRLSSPGSSAAAKWPPLGMGVQRRML